MKPLKHIFDEGVATIFIPLLFIVIVINGMVYEQDIYPLSSNL
jgi:hypothetical protein